MYEQYRVSKDYYKSDGLVRWEEADAIASRLSTEDPEYASKLIDLIPNYVNLIALIASEIAHIFRMQEGIELETDELVSVAYISVHKSMYKYANYNSPLVAYIRLTARRCMIDFLRSKRLEIKYFTYIYNLGAGEDSKDIYEGPPNSIEPEDAALRKIILEEAKARLTPLNWQLVELKFHGLNVHEISSILEEQGIFLNNDTIYRRIQRALKRLNQRYGTEEG